MCHDTEHHGNRSCPPKSTPLHAEHERPRILPPHPTIPLRQTLRSRPWIDGPSVHAVLLRSFVGEPPGLGPPVHIHRGVPAKTEASDWSVPAKCRQEKDPGGFPTVPSSLFLGGAKSAQLTFRDVTSPTPKGTLDPMANLWGWMASVHDGKRHASTHPRTCGDHTQHQVGQRRSVKDNAEAWSTRKGSRTDKRGYVVNGTCRSPSRPTSCRTGVSHKVTRRTVRLEGRAKGMQCTLWLGRTSADPGRLVMLSQIAFRVQASSAGRVDKNELNAIPGANDVPLKGLARRQALLAATAAVASSVTKPRWAVADDSFVLVDGSGDPIKFSKWTSNGNPPIGAMDEDSTPFALVVKNGAIADYVIQTNCSVENCEVNWDAGAGVFLCPCCQSQYNRETGGVLRGPAVNPLPIWKCSVDSNDNVVVTEWKGNDPRTGEKGWWL